jgi:acetyl esterase
MIFLPARFYRKAPVLAFLLLATVSPTFAAKFEVLRDLVYTQPNGTSITLDAYLIPDKNVHPAVIYVHGGGFVTGDKAHISTGFGEIFDLILANKISVISANYRLAPQHPYPAATDDIQQAISFIKKNKSKLRIDPNRLALMGDSAGGMLVSHAGAKYRPNNKVATVISFYGEHDFLLRVTENPCAMDGYTIPRPEGGCISGGMAAFLGFDKVTDKNKPILTDATVVTHVHLEMPSYLLIHGTRDYGVPIEQAHSMQDAMRRAGAECELVAVVGGGHGIGGWTAPNQVDYKQTLVDWLKRKLLDSQ